MDRLPRPDQTANWSKCHQLWWSIINLRPPQPNRPRLQPSFARSTDMQKSTNNCKIYCRPILKFVSRLSFNALIVQGRTDERTDRRGWLDWQQSVHFPDQSRSVAIHPTEQSLQEEQRELASFTITKQQCWAGQYYWGCGVVWLADDGDSDFWSVAANNNNITWKLLSAEEFRRGNVMKNVLHRHTMHRRHSFVQRLRFLSFQMILRRLYL